MMLTVAMDVAPAPRLDLVLRPRGGLGLDRSAGAQEGAEQSGSGQPRAVLSRAHSSSST